MTPLFDTMNVNDPAYSNMAKMETQYDEAMGSFLPTRADNTREVRVEVVSSLGGGEAGRLVYNSGDDKFYIHNGTEWTLIAGKGDVSV